MRPWSNSVDREKFAAYKQKFQEALCDDLNTSMALTVLYDMLKEDMTDVTKYALAEDFDKVLSLDLTTAHAQKEAEKKVDGDMECYILEKIEERKAAKKEKNFARAGRSFWKKGSSWRIPGRALSGRWRKRRDVKRAEGLPGVRCL